MGAWVLAAVVLGLVIGGLAQVRVDTSIGSFLPSGDATFEAVEDKAASFGGDPVVVLLESRQPKALLADAGLEGLLALEGRLVQLPDVSAVYGPATSLNQTAAAAQNLLAQISGRRDQLRNAATQRAEEAQASPSEVKKAGEDAVESFDRRYGTLLLSGLPAGLPTLRNPRFVDTIVFGGGSRPGARWRAVVPDENTVAILIRPDRDLDQAAAAELTRAVRETVDDAKFFDVDVTVTGVPALTSALADGAKRELPLLGLLALVAVGAVFCAVPWSGRRRSQLRPLLAAVLGSALVLALFGWFQHPVSLGVVAFLPILLGIGSDFPFYLLQRGHRRQALVAAAAAAAGFGALAVSPLPFVRELGLALAGGIVASVAMALGIRALFGVVPPPESEGRAAHVPSAPRWQRVLALGVVAAIAAGGWAALPGLDIESRPDQLARGLPELDDVRHAEDVLGSAGEVSLMLRGPDVSDPGALRWLAEAEGLVSREFGDRMHSIVALSDLLQFLGDDATKAEVDAGLEVLPAYLSSAVIRSDRTEALTIFGVGLEDLDQQKALFAEVVQTLPPPPPGFEVDLVGLPVSAVRGLDLVNDSRILINLAGILAAGVVLMVGLRRRGDAWRALLTIAVATGWVLALVWATSGSLSPLTVAIGSLTTATACEFSVMLAAAARRHARRLWLEVGTAAMAGSVGYLVLALSGIAVLRDFGLLLTASVLFSYGAAIVVLWATPAKERGSDAAVSRSEVPTDRVEVVVA